MPALIAWWTGDLVTLAPDADPSVVAEVGADLLRRWTETHRGYHTTQHLVEMFWALEELEDAGVISAGQGVVARVAAWVHDAVYDVSAPPGANEAASAELGVRDLTRLAVPSSVVADVDRLVRMTADHRADPDDTLEAAFHDADLWILSSPLERYDGYARQVRAEYAAVPDEAFRAGRTAILGDFAARPRLFLTLPAHAEWDGRARTNLRRELDALSGG